MISSKKRPVIIVGPSGVGKSLIAKRIAGENIPFKIDASTKSEKYTLATKNGGINLLTTPGSYQQDMDGSTNKILQLLGSDNPPEVICIVVAGGFHATESATMRGNFKRPGSNNVISDLDDYIKICRDEEIKFLELLSSNCDEMKHQVSAIITIANKEDLWKPYYDERKVDLISEYSFPRESSPSEYSQLIKIIVDKCTKTHAPNYFFFPMYTYGGGFHPKQDTLALSYTNDKFLASSILLRGLIYYYHTHGATLS